MNKIKNDIITSKTNILFNKLLENFRSSIISPKNIKSIYSRFEVLIKSNNVQTQCEIFLDTYELLTNKYGEFRLKLDKKSPSKWNDNHLLTKIDDGVVYVDILLTKKGVRLDILKL